ncbi:MAG: MFS transporter, partial [Chloroflexota bacterium]
ISTLLNLADRIPAKWMMSGAAIMAGIFTASIAIFANGLGLAILFRFLTGAVLAGVYPVGMKIMATWTQKDRGFAIGLLVGALTIGSAMPHLLNVFGGVQSWQPVMWLAAGLAICGGLIGVFFIEEGPYKTQSPPFDWRQIGKILADKDVMYANLGYLGHMWELYAMWSWIALFFLASFELSGIGPAWASGAAFAVIAIGGVGSYLAGGWADRFGRTTVTITSLVISGICALTIGFLFGRSPILLMIVALIWGITIVADSAQFSAAVSELAPREYLGTALTLQTSMGFLLTLFTIRMVPPIQAWVGWEYAFAFLAIGPIVGIWGMWRLRQSDAAVKLAGGNR